ncbi:MAG: hypothetical protein ACI4UY_12115 [Kiritimatiellia bacterium]
MKIYALANELNLDRSNAGTITVPFGTWDYGQKKLPDGRNLFFRQTLDMQGAGAIAAQIADSIAKGEKGVPVYWGHPDVPELAHKYPDKRAKGWITSASVEDGKLVLSVDWLEDKATDGFGWFSPFWTGPVKENGDGTALMHVESLASVALINMPNIQEFRLANELQDTNGTEVPGHANQKLIEELAAKRDGVVKLANVTDANGLSHGEDGKFDGGNGSSSSSSGKSDDIKINEWDDPKTRKMKERLIKMREKNAALREELANRRAALEKTKQESESIKNDIRRLNVESWKRRSRK